MDAIAAIRSRTSVRKYRPDPVPRESVQQLLDCAVRAPNHKLTEPWRFVVLTGKAKDQFAELRAEHRLKRFSDPLGADAQSAAAKVRSDASATPVFIVVSFVLNPDPITREEDYAATMMAVANIVTAAQALGLGTYLRTGGIMREPSLLRLACIPDSERVVAIISVGYPAETEIPRRRRPAAEVTRWLEQ